MAWRKSFDARREDLIPPDHRAERREDVAFVDRSSYRNNQRKEICEYCSQVSSVKDSREKEDKLQS